MENYDLVCIGAGAAGLTAAYTAVGFGKRVVLIDENLPGGECTWSGCIPSKALINAASEVHTVRKYVDDFTVDTAKVMQRVRNVIEAVYEHETPEKLAADGIEYRQCRAEFTGPDSLKAGDDMLSAKTFIVASGSSPFVPPIPGLADVPHLTNDNLFQLETLPASMIVLGGGAIGVEMAQAMNRLGVNVTLIEMLDTILFKEDADHVARLTKVLEKEGVVLRTGSKAVNVSGDAKSVTLRYENENGAGEISAERILVAVGRKARTEGLGLAEAGVSFGRRGIDVDAKLRTSNKKIFAIGDVVGPYQFSHMANVQGIRAVQNAILPVSSAVDQRHVAWCTFTQPELASAGLTEPEAREKFGNTVRVYSQDYSGLDRAKTKPGSIGAVKLILDRKGRLLGASILGDRAGELICELQLLKTKKMNMSALANVIHPYPTYAEILVKIAKRVKVDNLLNNPVVRLFRRK